MHVRVETDHGLLERELDLPAGEITLAALARAVLPLAQDVETLAARRAAGLGCPAACAKGCGACCRQLVTISPAEAFLLAELLETLPEPEHAATAARFSRAHDALAQAGLLTKLQRLADPALDEAAHYALARDYFRLGLPCPFQDAAGACGIYPLRPALCREYLVSTPPAECADPFAQIPRRLPVAAELSQALLGLSARQLRRELEPIPLTLAPAWARAHATDAARAWPARTLLSRFLLHLEVAIGQQPQF
jgi:Fe-S-cluster containining protein